MKELYVIFFAFAVFTTAPAQDVRNEAKQAKVQETVTGGEHVEHASGLTVEEKDKVRRMERDLSLVFWKSRVKEVVNVPLYKPVYTAGDDNKIKLQEKYDLVRMHWKDSAEHNFNIPKGQDPPSTKANPETSRDRVMTPLERDKAERVRQGKQFKRDSE